MRKIIFYLFTLSILLHLSSCDNSFLDENRKESDVYKLDVPLIVHHATRDFEEVSLELPDLKNKQFSIIQFPKIMHLKSLKGKIDESGVLKLSIKIDKFNSEINPEPMKFGELLLDIEGFGILSIDVFHLNFGNPLLESDKDVIDFGNQVSSTLELKIFNRGTGYLLFQIEESPAWLRVKPLNTYAEEYHTVLAGYSADFRLSIIKTNLQPGNYEEKLVLQSNDINKSRHEITVKLQVREGINEPHIVAIDGDVVGSCFDKNLNRLYVAAKETNQIYVFDMNDQSILKKITLSKSVSGVSLSADGQKLFVCQSGLVSEYKVPDYSLTRRIETDFIVKSVTDGENGYYYISKLNADFNTYFYSYELSTQKMIVNGTYFNRVEGDNILLLKDKSKILTVRTNTSPKGMYLSDISQGLVEYINYWHSTYASQLWQKEDGSVVVGKNGIVFKTPTKNTESVFNYLGVLKPDKGNYDSYELEYGFPYSWIDLCDATHSVWGVYKDISESKNNKVIEWDDNTYDIRRTIHYEDYYTTIDGAADFYETEPHYVFASKEGNKIVLVKNILNKGDYSTAVRHNKWHLEFIDL